MKVLVTGGAGYLGSYLVKNLLDEDNITKITVYDNLSTGKLTNLPNDQRLEFIEGDVLDKEKLNSISDINIIFHFASINNKNFCESNPEIAKNVNINGTKNIYDLALRNLVNVILASSDDVYQGTANDKKLDTKAPCNITSVYGHTKYYAESIAKEFESRYNIHSKILRFFSVYGNENSEDNVVNVFLNCRENFLPGPVFGNGEQLRDFIHVFDAVEMSKRAWLYTNPKITEIFNIATGNATSINTLGEILDLKLIHYKAKEDQRINVVADVSYNSKLSYTPRNISNRSLLKDVSDKR